MNYRDFFPGLFLLVLSACASVLAFQLGLGSVHKPGSGLIPFGTTILLALMSAGLIVKSLVEPGKSQKRRIFEGVRWKTLIVVLSGLAGYGLVLNWLGFGLSTFILMTLLLGVSGRQKWWLMFVTSALIVFCAYLVFVVWLECQLPRGWLGI